MKKTGILFLGLLLTGCVPNSSLKSEHLPLQVGSIFDYSRNATLRMDAEIIADDLYQSRYDTSKMDEENFVESSESERILERFPSVSDSMESLSFGGGIFVDSRLFEAWLTPDRYGISFTEEDINFIIDLIIRHFQYLEQGEYELLLSTMLTMDSSDGNHFHPLIMKFMSENEFSGLSVKYILLSSAGSGFRVILQTPDGREFHVWPLITKGEAEGDSWRIFRYFNHVARYSDEFWKIRFPDLVEYINLDSVSVNHRISLTTDWDNGLNCEEKMPTVSLINIQDSDALSIFITKLGAYGLEFGRIFYLIDGVVQHKNLGLLSGVPFTLQVTENHYPVLTTRGPDGRSYSFFRIENQRLVYSETLFRYFRWFTDEHGQDAYDLILFHMEGGRCKDGLSWINPRIEITEEEFQKTLSANGFLGDYVEFSENFYWIKGCAQIAETLDLKASTPSR